MNQLLEVTIEAVTKAVIDGLCSCMSAKWNASYLVGSYLLVSNVVLDHEVEQLVYSIINRCSYVNFQCVHLYQNSQTLFQRAKHRVAKSF